MNHPVLRRALCITLCLITSTALANAETRRQTALSYVQLGDQFVENKEFDRAIRTYNLALQFDTGLALAYYRRAFAQQARGDYKEAIADYTKMLEIVPECAEAFANRAYVLAMQQRDFDKALEDWSSALNINPKMKTVFNDRGYLRLRQGDVERALADFDRAVESDPNYGLAYNNRGIARVGLGDLEGAIGDFTRALRLNPRFLEAYVNRGLVLLQQGMKREAEKDFARAVELKPSLGAIIKHRIEQISQQ